MVITARRPTIQAGYGYPRFIEYARAALLLVLLTLATNLWADVRAILDRSTIYDGETVNLTIEASGKDESGEPDLAPLNKDFNVLGTSSSQRIEIINGRRSDSRQWQVELEPRKTGTLEVPALKVGHSATQPVTLKVMEQSAVSTVSGDRPVFIRTEARTGAMDVYVQQQILYVVRLYYRVPLLQGEFNDPQLADAVVERLGEDRRFKTTINGTDYQVVERHYAIFPEKSGELTIPSIAFTGRAASTSTRRSPSLPTDPLIKRFFGRDPFSDPFFSGMTGNPGKRFRVRSEPLTLDVKARPTSYTGKYWLPTQALELEDSWEQQLPGFHVGEPVTRTITLKARGLESSQLPALDFPSPQGVRIYPEQPVTENLTDGDWIYGVSKQTLAYVPSTTGRVVLPAVQVDWWDTANHQQRSTRLPAREINVLPAAGGVSTTPPVAAPETTPDTTTPADTTPGWREWVLSRNGLLATGVAVLVLAVVWGWRRYLAGKREPIAAETQGGHTQPSRHASRRESRVALKKACEANDPHAAAKALLEWAADEWPQQPPRNLGALAQRLESGREEVRRLDQVLYSGAAGEWQGEALWSALKTGLESGQDRKRKEPGGLAPLYPATGSSRS